MAGVQECGCWEHSLLLALRAPRTLAGFAEKTLISLLPFAKSHRGIAQEVLVCILSSRDQHVACMIGCRMEQTADHRAADHTKTETHPISTSQRLKRTLQEYEQSILQQQAAAEQELLDEAAAAVQTSKQVRPSAVGLCRRPNPAINPFLPCTQHRRIQHGAAGSPPTRTLCRRSSSPHPRS